MINIRPKANAITVMYAYCTT